MFIESFKERIDPWRTCFSFFYMMDNFAKGSSQKAKCFDFIQKSIPLDNIFKLFYFFHTDAFQRFLIKGFYISNQVNKMIIAFVRLQTKIRITEFKVGILSGGSTVFSKRLYAVFTRLWILMNVTTVLTDFMNSINSLIFYTRPLSINLKHEYNNRHKVI